MKPGEIQMQYAYWAGVFDYRGFIGMRKCSGRRYPCIAIRSVNRECGPALKKLFGGTIQVCRNGTTKAWVWQRTGAGAVRIIKRLVPYLKQRDQDIAIVFGWRASKTGPKPGARAVRGRAMSGSE